MVQRDWFEWHRPYGDETSPLAGRLRVVQRHIVEFLDAAPPGEISVISMCAGQGRDLLEVLTHHPRMPDVAARLVELDPRNAKVAMDSVATAGLTRVEVVTGDASITTAYEGMVPCDLVLACGVFGHAADGDIESMIGHLPTLCAPGATVVWTRGALGFDLRPTIRKWFLEAGFEEIDFTSGEGGWGVGTNRMVAEPQPFRAGIRLFTFVDTCRAAEHRVDPTMSVGWLPDGSEDSLRSAMGVCAPQLADLPIRMNPRHAASNPLWWSSSAVVDDRFVVKFAWSKIRAGRLWREGVVLERLRAQDPLLALPELVVFSREPALVVTRRMEGEPLSWEWASNLGDGETTVAEELAAFLVRLHAVEPGAVIGDLPVVSPTAQADTGGLRRRFPRLVDDRRGQSVMRWCAWVDDVLHSGPMALPEVLVHGDLHGYNQVWDRASASLLAVVDFEESGIADPHFDLRYLPGNSQGPQLVLAVMAAYEQLSGRRLSIERVMAWHVLTALGDAMWRTEAGVSLPGGGTATTYVDRLSQELAVLELD